MAKKSKKREAKKEPVITDILEERFLENGESMVKRTYMRGKEVIKEEVEKD